MVEMRRAGCVGEGDGGCAQCKREKKGFGGG